eukprot:3325022-Pyramimonas_sp.AAC.1
MHTKTADELERDQIQEKDRAGQAARKCSATTEKRMDGKAEPQRGSSARSATHRGRQSAAPQATSHAREGRVRRSGGAGPS